MAENIKIIRLQGGEDIIADCLEDTNHLILGNPMHLIFKRGVNNAKIMVLLPWLPVEIISENIASVPHKDILLSLQPKKDMIDYYLETVQMLNVQLDQSSINFDGDDDSDESMFDELLDEAIEQKKNSSIH